jgi:hypothetical protein
MSNFICLITFILYMENIQNLSLLMIDLLFSLCTLLVKYVNTS